jgi:hypothetical protein
MFVKRSVLLAQEGMMNRFLPEKIVLVKEIEEPYWELGILWHNV